MDYCEALEKILKSNIVWIEAQSCSGESINILKSGCRSLENLFFNSSPFKLYSTICGEKCGKDYLNELLSQKDFVLVIEGAIPKGKDELCYVGEYTCSQLISMLAEKAKAIIAVGSCAVNGGIIRELGYVGVSEFLGKKVYEVPGCPASEKMMVAAIYYALTGDAK
ncbi:Ni,Fe-hydrogenase I small subunit [Sulfolobus sp. S-194]|uniref:NADH-quinone oxidoreductase subunit B family protein n=1 Tax=Sulfolobus sp. S-194 TaxID=2512240 RepID=UPI001436CCC9|nr:Ni,Fe-hydrogenase I small subunit [Sulfolobus sp. S-194]QIW23926.1 Ni,Fe-hydrogenase I small subunit [Sulfolobus sp. S-194]